MAFLIQNSVIVNDQRELIGVNTAGIDNSLFVGANIEMEGTSGVITASNFVGSGASLTDIDANVIVSDGIPTGISTTEGDLYYDSTDLKLFTYYDNNWVEASPVPPGATTLEVTNEAGITTAQIDLFSETLILSGTPNEVDVAVDEANNTLTFGLTNDVSIGGSITASELYGDGSNLTGVGIDPTGDIITTGNIQAGVITATANVIAEGTARFDGNVTVGNAPGDLLLVNSEIVGNLVPLVDNNDDLGSAVKGWRSLYLETSLIGNNSTNILGINSVTATEYYGDGSNLTGIGLSSTEFYEVGGVQAGVITATEQLVSTKTLGVGLTVSGQSWFGEAAQFSTLYGNSGGLGSLTIGQTEEGPFPAVSTRLAIAGDRTNFQSQSGVNKVVFIDGSFNDFFVLDYQNDIIEAGADFTVGVNSITAANFYGSGEFLTDIEGTAIAYNTVANDSENNDLPMPFLSAVGAGASMYTDSTPSEQFTYNPSSGILKAKEFDALSDARLKTDIVEIEDALGKVADLRGVEYNWINGSGSSVGVIAQELQEVYPQLVSDNGERLTVNYNGLVGLLIAAVNEISAELAELKAQK